MIDPDRVAAGIAHQLEQLGRSHTEMDHLDRKIGDLVEQSAHVRQDAGAVGSGRERPDPRIEDLQGARARPHLRPEMGHDHVDERPHQGVPRGRIGEHQRLRPGVIPARAPFDQIAREGEGRPREADQRHVELPREGADGLERVRLVGLGLQRTEPRDVGPGSERLVQHRSATGLDPKGDPDRDERHHDVAEQDRSVERHPPEGLQRDLDGLVWDPDRLEDVAITPEVAVLGEVAAGLAHEPDRRAVDRFSTQCAEQSFGGKGHGLPRIRGSRGTPVRRARAVRCRARSRVRVPPCGSVR